MEAHTGVLGAHTGVLAEKTEVQRGVIVGCTAYSPQWHKNSMKCLMYVGTGSQMSPASY